MAIIMNSITLKRFKKEMERFIYTTIYFKIFMKPKHRGLASEQFFRKL